MKRNLLLMPLLAWALFVPIAAVNAIAESPPQELKELEELERYNWVLGTQTFAPNYKHTEETELVETAGRIRQMGSNLLKIALDAGKFSDTKEFKAASPTDLLKREPSFGQVLQMDFTYYLFWVYTPGVHWQDGMSAEEKEREYACIKELAVWLLSSFSGTGKEFYLGHWEGDWYLVDRYDREQTIVSPTRLQGMADWYNIRQKAVEDALKETPHHDVKLYQYAELNLVRMKEPMDRIVNRVLPYVNVDYVSYSAYESLEAGSYEGVKSLLERSLDTIANNLPRKEGFNGRRVFIGEYGFPLRQTQTPAEQERRARWVMRIGLEWGCPFILYWQMYDNEKDAQGQLGFWMIDDKDEKQPVYETHERFYREMKEWVREFQADKKRLPTPEEYRQKAASFFK